MTPALTAYMQGWYAKVAQKQTKRGIAFELTYDDFLALWGARRLATMQKHMDDGSIYARMSGGNPFAFVVTWKSYAAKQSGVMNIETAQVCTRSKSKADNGMRKGDKHSQEVKDRISASKQGKTHSESHRQALSKALTGVKKGPMSAEHKAKLSAAMKAARALQKAAQQGGAA